MARGTFSCPEAGVAMAQSQIYHMAMHTVTALKRERRPWLIVSRPGIVAGLGGQGPAEMPGAG